MCSVRLLGRHLGFLGGLGLLLGGELSPETKQEGHCCGVGDAVRDEAQMLREARSESIETDAAVGERETLLLEEPHLEIKKEVREVWKSRLVRK